MKTLEVACKEKTAMKIAMELEDGKTEQWDFIFNWIKDSNIIFHSRIYSCYLEFLK